MPVSPATSAQCPRCAAPLTAVSGGLCLRCVGERALRSGLGEEPLTPGSAAHPPLAPRDGTDLPQPFGAYEIIEEIGRGGMGAVYLAREVDLNRLVALKVIAAGQLATAEAEARFVRESQTIALLQHPAIVSVHAAGRCAGRLFYAMAHIDGIDLGRACAIDPLEPREAARLLAAVARGIHHAHERGIIHRDLKPANILLDTDGAPHVADFGLARWTFEPAGLTRTGQILGSPAFMPPEQAAGDSSPAVDIYALGAVLYFALTGQPPFAAPNALEALSRIVREPARPPSVLQPTVPAALDAIVLRALEKKPADRYPTAAEFADDLDRWCAGDAVRTPFAPMAAARRLVEEVRDQIRRSAYSTALWPSYAEQLTRAAQLAPELAAPHQELARLHVQLLMTGADRSPARRELARQSIERAEALDPTSIDTRSTRVLYMIGIEGRADEAWPALLEVARERPDDPRIQSVYGRACLRTGRWSEAKRVFRRQVDLEPTLAIPRTVLAYTLAHVREYDDAAFWQKESLRHEGGLDFSHLIAAWYYWLANPTSLALAHLRTHPGIDRSSPIYAWCECQVLLALRRPAEALALYERCLDAPKEHMTGEIESEAYRLHLQRLAGVADSATPAEATLRSLLAPGRQVAIKLPQEALQFAYARAMLGQREEALALADQGVAMCPISQHAVEGARYAGANEFFTVPGRLVILALVGERDRFFAELERLINVPAAIDPRYLGMDPTFDTLREDPRFNRIMTQVQIPIQLDAAEPAIR